jgi:hypothetical protein
MKSYEKILMSHLDESMVTFANIDTSERHKQMSALVTKKVEEMDKARWKFHLGDEELVVAGTSRSDRQSCAIRKKLCFAGGGHGTARWVGVGWSVHTFIGKPGEGFRPTSLDDCL